MVILLSIRLYRRNFSTRIATTALRYQWLRPVRRDRRGQELSIPMAGNTGARGSKLCSDLFGLGRVCLHFNSGWQLVDLREGSFVHNMRQTCAYPKRLKWKETRRMRVRYKGDPSHSPEGYFSEGNSGGHSHLFCCPMERLSPLDPLQEFIGAVSESLPIIVQPNFITNLHLLIKDRYSLFRITPV